MWRGKGHSLQHRHPDKMSSDSIKEETAVSGGPEASSTVPSEPRVFEFRSGGFRLIIITEIQISLTLDRPACSVFTSPH